MTPRLTIGIDIGGTNTAFGVVDEHGIILQKGVVPTTGHSNIDAYIVALKEGIMPLIAQWGASNFAGLGVGAPSANYHTGEIIFAPNLPWKGIIPMSAMLSIALGFKTWVTNDANAAAIGEMKYGIAKGLANFVMVTLGTGLGSGFVANGQLIYGHDGMAGELGHVIARRGGRLCGCGRHGCLETYVSATGIVRTANEWLESRTDPSELRGIGKALTALAVQEAAQRGDALAKELYAFTGNILGECLADVVAITSPEAFVFFGGLAHGKELIIAPTRKSMEANLLHLYRGKVKMLLSALPDADAAILGASALVQF